MLFLSSRETRCLLYELWTYGVRGLCGDHDEALRKRSILHTLSSTNGIGGVIVTTNIRSMEFSLEYI